jgi:hypothetical protein
MTISTHDELRDILVARDSERKGLINDFLTKRKTVFLRQSAILCTHFRQNRNTMFEDIAQIVAQTAFEMILDMLKRPEQLEEFGSFDSVLKTRSRYAVGAYLRSSAHTPLSGMSNVERRRAQIARTRNNLRDELGHDPDDDQVIEKTNERLIATNKDPKRSGFLVSRDDLDSNVRVSSIIDETERVDADESHQPDSHGATGLHIAEHGKFLDLVAERLATHKESEEITKVAKHWLSTGLTTEVLTGSDIATYFDIDTTKARSHLRTIKKEAAAVLMELNTER